MSFGAIGRYRHISDRGSPNYTASLHLHTRPLKQTQKEVKE